jgi:hypothetical protein
VKKKPLPRLKTSERAESLAGAMICFSDHCDSRHKLKNPSTRLNPKENNMSASQINNQKHILCVEVGEVNQAFP